MKRFKKEDYEWRNTFPRNPIQTKYLRFLKKPDSNLKTDFTDIRDEFQAQMQSFKKAMEDYK